VPYRDITSELHGYQPPRVAREVFRTQAQLVRYLRRVTFGPHVNLPQIDWTRREAILVAMGPRSSTGYSLHVVKLLADGGQLVLTVRERTPSLGATVSARVTYPFVFITVRRTGKSVVLHFQGRP
jgi:PrcB C-terminal